MEQTPTSVPVKSYEELQRQTDDANETVIRMKESGVSSAAIYDILIKKGIEHTIAVHAIESAKPGGSTSKSLGRNDMIVGACWIAGGLIVTIGTYMAASENGGHYFITYGPVIYG